jgi:trans-aconitate methyltransferase
MELKYLFLLGLVFILYSVSVWASGREGFETGESLFVEDPFDATYASIYNALWNPEDKMKYERISIQETALADWPISNVNILDLSCKTAANACWFVQFGVKYTGVDASEDMISQAKKDCPSATFKKGDPTDAKLFAPKAFSHVFMFNFSAYSIPNAKLFSDNAYMWTQPGGYFVVHLVDPDKFDPLLDLASPFAAFSLQKYSLERQTDSEIYFDQFKYVGKFNKKNNEDTATYEETLTYFDTTKSPKNIKYREQKQEWTMPSVPRMIDIFKASGFRHKETLDLVSAGKEYQYLVFFTK